MINKIIFTLRFIFVSVGIVALTSVGIDAADTFLLARSETALAIFAKKITTADCPTEMVRISSGDDWLCVDKYEASVGSNCSITEPKSSKDTAVNMADNDCLPQVANDRRPWTFVALPQAKELCAKAGKRLPTTDEWFRAAIGTADGVGCNTDGSLSNTGLFTDCYSGVGAFDMVGNVWEWVSGEVKYGIFDGIKLPEEGFIAGVDSLGVPNTTSLKSSAIFNDDYFWVNSSEVTNIMRGGFYGSKSDGGIYTFHAKNNNTFSSQAIGFRCVKDLVN